MPGIDSLINAFATYFVTIDPPGLVAIFLGLTTGMTSAERHSIALRSVVTAMIILVAFILIGGALLSLLGITIAAFRVAGGLLLFYIAFEMIFEKRVERKESTAERVISKAELQSIAIFPIAIPLIAGPGAISASILLAPAFVGATEKAFLIGTLLSIGLIIYLGFLAADRLDKFINESVKIVLTRLLGILLAALAIQFVADGASRLAQGPLG